MLSSFTKITLYFLLNILLLSETMSDNKAIKIISDYKYPIILSKNTRYYNIITSKKIFIVDKNSNNISIEKGFQSYDPNFFICIDESNKYFLLAKNKYYNIELDYSQFKINSYSSYNIKLSDNIAYSGYIKHYKFKQKSNIVGARCGVDKNEIIIYGTKDNKIYFHFVNKKEGFSFGNFNRLRINISCKLIEDVKYICAYFEGSKLKIGVFLHVFILINFVKSPGIHRYEEKEMNDFSNCDNPIISDTLDKNCKILCVLDKNNEIRCKKIYVTITQVGVVFLPIITIVSISDYYDYLSFNIGYCYLTGFYSEYLFCCTTTNIITCKRLDKNFDKINEFNINIEGENSYLTIMNNINSAVLFFMNKNKDIYQYFIYPPKCKYISIKLNISQSISINFYDYYDRKEYLKYFLEFIDLPNEYGTIKINEENITSINKKIELKDNENFFIFLSDKEKIVSNHKINYNISIEETYSVQCSIYLTIKQLNDTIDEAPLNQHNICHYTCKTCIDEPILDEIGNIKNQNCINCTEGYNLMFGTNNCYDNSILEQGYYLSSNDSMYHKCDTQCKTCKENVTNKNIYCISCNNNQGYYSVENTSIFECFNSENIENYYYLKEYYDPKQMKIIKEWALCYLTCASCYGEGTSTLHNCKECISNYHLIADSTDCITEEYAFNHGYYLNSETNNFEKCYIACSRCNKSSETNNTNCIECNYEEGFYPIYEEDANNCFNNDTIKGGYYLDEKEIPYKWKKCYEKCEECNESGNSTNMNCLSCKNNLLNNSPYRISLTSIGNCILVCSNGTYQFLNTCLESCPYNYVINEKEKKCVLKSFDITTTLDEFKSIIKYDITNFVNSSALINGSDFMAVISSSNDMNPQEQIKKGISTVDLGNCSQVIKAHYNISDGEHFIVLNIELKRNETKNNERNSNGAFNLGKNVQIEIYDSSGRKLDLSVCKEDIKIMKYIGDVTEELNIDSAKSYADSGVDVFNANDSFFNDLCHKYDNKDGMDIIIEDRRIDLYQNATFCQEGCSYTGVNYELMAANCLCDSNLLQNENNLIYDNKEQSEILTFKTITKSFISNLLNFNIDVIFCYNLVFNLKILSTNIGFFSMFVMLLSQIIFLCIFLVKKLKPIQYFMFIFKNTKSNAVHASPPKNKILNDNKNAFDQNKINKNIIIKDKKKKNVNQKNDDKNLFINIKKNESYNDNSKKLFQSINEEKIGEVVKNINLEEILQNNLSKINPNNKNNMLSAQSLSKHKLFSKGNPQTNKIDDEQGDKIIVTNNFAPTINIQTPVLNINHRKKNIKRLNNLISSKNKGKQLDLLAGSKSNNSLLYNIKNKSNSKKGFLKKREITNKKMTNIETIADIKNDVTKKNIIIRLSNTDEDLQDMDFEEAIIQDKRSYLRMYWSFLVDSQIILGTFCTDNYLNLLVIKLSFLVCTFEINFFLNALFYTDDYISDAYHNDGVLDFVSGLPKSIYSFAATLITTNLLRMLSNSKSELMKLIREYSRDKKYLYLINLKLRRLKIKLPL